ncbi:MAG: SPFH domain-containing protein [Opitutales bacterium]
MNLLLFKYIRVPYEHLGLKFKEGQFIGLIRPGSTWVFDPFNRIVIKVLAQTVPRIDLHEPKLKQLKDHPETATLAEFVDLKDNERGLVWYDDRFRGILRPGTYGYWTSRSKICIETIPIETIRFTHPEFDTITRHPDAQHALDVKNVPQGHAGVLFIDERYSGQLNPGRYAFWRDSGSVKLHIYELRENVLEYQDPEIPTKDRVNTSIKAVVTFQIEDPSKLAETTTDSERVLRRELQRSLQSAASSKTLDELLLGRSIISTHVFSKIKESIQHYGIRIIDLRIQEIKISEKEMGLLNQTKGPSETAQAGGFTRREDTATMQS